MTKNDMLRRSIHLLKESPRLLFLVDSFGALSTAFLLSGVLRTFNQHVGLSKQTLTLLAVIAACISIFSATCFIFLKRGWAPFIYVVGGANLFYCVVIAVLLIANRQQITTLGLSYFVAEIVVICVLVYIELNVALILNRRVT